MGISLGIWKSKLSLIIPPPANISPNKVIQFFVETYNCIYLSSSCLDEKVELSEMFIMVQNCILAHHPRLKNLHNSFLRSFENIVRSQ